jgi:hypothetical protein
MIPKRAVPRPAVVLMCVLGASWLTGCGGGGGGGGSGGGGGPDDPPAADKVEFIGFTFQVGQNAPTSAPPLENTTSVPPTLGAPLDLKVIFSFTGVPQGPFTQSNLPVFTTDTEVTPLAFPPLGQTVIAAKGTYVLVGNTVEFRPFVPTEPLQVKLSAPPAAVPGLLPSSVYTAQVVTTNGQKLPNLQGPGGTVKFGTTSNPAAYYSSGQGDGTAPTLLASLPPDGTTGFSPGIFSNFAPGAALPTFPDGPVSFTLSYDSAILPTNENILGKDWDGDGVIEPAFFLRSRATRLLVGSTVPAGSTIGNAQEFPAIAGLTDGLAVPMSGDDIFLHNSQGAGALPGASPQLSAVPGSIATGADPSLLWVVLKVDGGNDLLTVVDHVLGDPSFAKITEDTALDTGLDDVVGLTTLQSGRLVAFDRTTLRIYELLADVVRHRPTGTPELASPNGDGMVGIGFTSDPFSAGTTLLDMAQTPDGTLLGLAESGGSFPVIVRLVPIDPDLDSVFEADDGTVDGSFAPVPLMAAYAAVESISDELLFGLNRSDDTIDVLSLDAGKLSTAIQDVAAYGVPLASLPGGLSPAQTLALGFLNMDVEVTVQSNDDNGAIVVLEPAGILPIGEDVAVMQRHTLASLQGVSAANEDPSATLSVLGAEQLLTVTTSSPIATVGACTVPDPEGRVNDVYQEEFLETTYEDTTPPSLSPQAEWAEVVNGSIASGNLRASVGASAETTLGDFRPSPFPDFNLATAYSQLQAQVDAAHFSFVFLDTDVQNFPLPGGATPGVTSNTTVLGGKFAFHDFIIPEGVWVVVRGSNPLQITATGTVEIRGVLDCAGTDGVGDDTFDTGYIPVPGGGGGPGGGRGGNGHPTLFDPNGPGLIRDYVTPETGERGFGPEIDKTGAIIMKQIGGHGGFSSLGPDFNGNGFPKINNANNTEWTRVPGGGGGSFYYHGMYAHEGAGAYKVQSNSTYFPFTLCPGNDKIQYALYGNEERLWQGMLPNTPLQCVYLIGTPAAPNYLLPGGAEGDLVFKDGDPTNDFIGEGGELAVLIGGQGGGGGGTRVDSMGHTGGAIIWGGDDFGNPIQFPPLAPPYYPTLGGGAVYYSPTLWDAKGGGGGGGGGSVLIRTFGDILISRAGHIDASGGAGEGGESIKNSNYAGGGGGGSGGAVVLQAAGEIRIEADPGHKTPYYQDSNGDIGASIDVSGGFGKDAVTRPNTDTSTNQPDNDFTRSDGGQGGFGLIQLQAGGIAGAPTIEQGAYLFARLHNVLKLGGWTGDPTQSGPNNAEHPTAFAGGVNQPPDDLRYIDILEYRYFKYDDVLQQFWSLLNGADPPLITPSDTVAAGPYQLDTPMITHFGRRVVKEPEPQKVMKTYAGWDPVTFKENYNGTNLPPGTLYDASDSIPMSMYLTEPDGTPIFEVVNGVPTAEFSRFQTIDRLPVVPIASTPLPIGNVSRGTSLWLDFSGVALRFRNAQGVPPPLFSGGINGTYNAKQGVVPPDKEGNVITGSAVVGKPAHYVAKTGSIPFFDPGLCVVGPGPYPPYNDIKVDAPEVPELGIENAISDNAAVSLFFQGAYPVRAGSHVPDDSTLTEWVADLRELSGYPLVRFQVVFDLAADTATYPFGVDSFRPAVDRVRMRANY